MIAIRKIVVATDFGEAAEAALAYGCDFARAFGADLHLVHVVDDVTASAAMATTSPAIDLCEVQRSIVDDAQGSIEKVVGGLAGHGVELRTVLLTSHQPAHAILNYAQDIECDLVIVGTHGRGGIAEFFLGTVAQKLVRSACCPVLTVRASEHVQPRVTQLAHVPLRALGTA